MQPIYLEGSLKTNGYYTLICTCKASKRKTFFYATYLVGVLSLKSTLCLFGPDQLGLNRQIGYYAMPCTYGIKHVGRKVTKSMSYFLHLCDCSVPYCASLEAWNWVVAWQHLDASHPRSSVGPNPNIPVFSGNYFLEKLKTVITPQPLEILTKFQNWELGLSIFYHLVLNIPRDRPQHFRKIETIHSSLHSHSPPQSNAIHYKFMTFIGFLFCLRTSCHIWGQESRSQLYMKHI